MRAIGVVVFLLGLAAAKNSLAADRRAAWGDRGPLVSRVGSVSSYVSSFESEGGAHPTYGCRLISTFRQATEGKQPVERPALLTDLFAESDIMTALFNAWPIRVALGGRTPRNLKALLAELEPTCDVPWNELPNSFAIMAVVEDADQGTCAVVRFGLGHGCEAARGSKTEFDVLIRIPNEQLAAFRSAAAQKRLGLGRTCGRSHEWACCLMWSR